LAGGDFVDFERFWKEAAGVTWVVLWRTLGLGGAFRLRSADSGWIGGVTSALSVGFLATLDEWLGWGPLLASFEPAGGGTKIGVAVNGTATRQRHAQLGGHAIASCVASRRLIQSQAFREKHECNQTKTHQILCVASATVSIENREFSLGRDQVEHAPLGRGLIALSSKALRGASIGGALSSRPFCSVVRVAH
jgi:hypothetical protein